MLLLLTLAWRNVLRNRRRSAITVLSVALGLAAMTFVWAFIDGMNRQMIVNSTRLFAGDMQVHLKGYQDDPTLELVMPDAAALLTRLRADPDVVAAASRLEGQALASRADKSRGVLVVGVDPAQEARVSSLSTSVMQGEALKDNSEGALIGAQLANALGLAVGDELLLVGQAYDGSIASGKFPLRGVFRTEIEQLDSQVALLPLDLVREFFVAPDASSALVLRLRARDTLASTQARLARQTGVAYEVLGWPQLLPMVAVMARFHDVMAWVVLAVFFGIIAAAVVNPVLMSVLERTREFGILLALGMRRARLLALVLLEATLLGLCGLVLGNLLGLAFTAYFARTGIDLSAFGAALRTMPGLENITYPLIRFERSAMVSLVVFAITGLTALYPALRASALEPVAAIRGLIQGTGAARRTRVGPSWASTVRWPLLLAIAARNIVRNRWRSAITVAGTAFGILAFVFLYGYFDGFGEELIDNSTRYLTGHAQIERQDFRQDYAPALAFDGADALLARLRSTPSVQAAAARVQVQALASSATRSRPILLTGIQPDAESAVTFIHRTVLEGKALANGDDKDILIGRELARRLGVRLGEKVIVMAQAANGELGSAAWRVSGIFATESAAFDSTMAFVSLPAAQAMLALGPRVSTINLRLHERQSLDGSRAALEGLLPPGLTLQPWQVLLPQVEQMILLTRVISDIVLAIAFLVVTIAIMNTVFMAVAERTREFGVMMALGTPAPAIWRMVLYETLMLMLLASLIGYGGGALLVAYFGQHGIDFSAFFQGYSSIPGLTGIVHPKLVAASLAPPGILLFGASVLVSLYPAMRATRLDPAQAIRHV